MHMMRDISPDKLEKNIIFIPVDDYSATQFDLNTDNENRYVRKGRIRATQFLKMW